MKEQKVHHLYNDVNFSSPTNEFVLGMSLRQEGLFISIFVLISS